MTKLKVLSFFISVSVFSLTLYLTGCGNNSTNPVNQNITVNGKLIDFTGNGVQGATVVINGTTTTSGADGSFSISNIKTPYDLKIVSGGAKGIIYKGLTTANPIAYAFGVITTPNSSVLTVSVPFGYLSIGQEAIVTFTDTTKVQSSNYIISPGNSTNFNVVWSGNMTLAGKVLVLVASLNGSGNISGYNHYAEKTFTLNNATPSTVSFAASDFTVIPGSATVSGTIIAPAGYSGTTSSVYLGYTPGSALNTGVLIDGLNGSGFSFLVPTGLTTSFKLFVRGNSNGVGTENTTKFMTVVSPSSSNTITLDPVPALSTPVDNAVGVDTNTIFTYSSISGTGIYILSATPMAGTKGFFVFTSDISATLPNFSAYGLLLGPSTIYRWEVERILGVTSMDNFVSSVFLYNTQFNGLTISQQRQFTSAP
jgi:hypothetical protein